MNITNETHTVLSLSSDEMQLLEQVLANYPGPFPDAPHPNDKVFHDERVTLARKMHEGVNDELMRQYHREQIMEMLEPRSNFILKRKGA